MHRAFTVTTAVSALLLWAVSCLARSAADFTRNLDLGELQGYAVENNPDIKAAEQRWRAAQARPPQMGSLPDPMINTGYHNEGFDRLGQGRSDFSWLRLGAEQEVPYPGKLRLREEIASRDAQREHALYQATVLGIRSRVRVAYDELYFAEQSIAILHSNVDLLKKLIRAAEARYQVGEGLQQDIARAEVELSVLLGRVAEFEQQKASAAAMLNALLNRSPSAPLGSPAPLNKQPLSRTLADFEQLATEQSPTLQAAGLDVASAQAGQDLAQRQYYPDFVVRADYFNKAALVPEWEVGLGIRVPLYFWRKQLACRKRPRRRRQRATCARAHGKTSSLGCEISMRKPHALTSWWGSTARGSCPRRMWPCGRRWRLTRSAKSISSRCSMRSRY